MNEDYLKELQFNFIHGFDTKIISIETCIINLEKRLVKEEVEADRRFLLGEFHSLKGNASALRFKSIEIFCHNIEDFIIDIALNEFSKNVDKLLSLIDPLKEYISEYKKNSLVDEGLFLSKYGQVFGEVKKEKVLSVQTPGEKKLELNVLAVGIPSSLINNIKKFTKDFHFIISYARDSQEALSRLQTEQYDLIFSSYFMEPLDGLSLCMAVKYQWKKNNTKFVILPAQDLVLDSSYISLKLMPDKIIIKDQEMYSQIADFCKAQFAQTQVVSSKICFVDDDPLILDLYQVEVEKMNGQFKFINPSFGDYEDTIFKFTPDLIISDINMPNINIVDFYKKFSQMKFLDTQSGKVKKTKMIFFSGDPESETSKKLLQLGAHGVFNKGDIISDLSSLLVIHGLKLK
jgi:CheY-like chemotaxis protein